MNDYARREALRALDAARPAIARLDSGRHTEDVAADLIDGWSAVETALRSLVGTGSTALSGQALIREARQRNLIGFDQANALAEFNAARDRVSRTDYQPTDADTNAARAGFLKFESALMAPEPSARDVATAPMTAAAAPVTTAPGTPTEPIPVARSGRDPKWLVIGGIVAAVIVLVVAGILLFGRRGSSDALEQGIQYYQRGQREAAVTQFNTVVRDDPNNAVAHVYLSRMAREVGNLTLAHQEAVAAVQADKTSSMAMRELASYFLTVGDYNQARVWFTHALQQSPDDRASQGWLGCTLVKLGNPQLAMNFFNRAGQGPWSTCMPTATGMPPQGYPQGATQPPPVSP